MNTIVNISKSFMDVVLQSNMLKLNVLPILKNPLTSDFLNVIIASFSKWGFTPKKFNFQTLQDRHLNFQFQSYFNNLFPLSMTFPLFSMNLGVDNSTALSLTGGAFTTPGTRNFDFHTDMLFPFSSDLPSKLAFIVYNLNFGNPSGSVFVSGLQIGASLNDSITAFKNTTFVFPLSMLKYFYPTPIPIS